MQEADLQLMWQPYICPSSQLSDNSCPSPQLSHNSCTSPQLSHKTPPSTGHIWPTLQLFQKTSVTENLDRSPAAEYSRGSPQLMHEAAGTAYRSPSPQLSQTAAGTPQSCFSPQLLQSCLNPQLLQTTVGTPPNRLSPQLLQTTVGTPPNCLSPQLLQTTAALTLSCHRKQLPQRTITRHFISDILGESPIIKGMQNLKTILIFTIHLKVIIMIFTLARTEHIQYWRISNLCLIYNYRAGKALHHTSKHKKLVSSRNT
jgi:hypothetical protein